MASSGLETKVVHAVCSHDCPDSCGVLVTVESLTAPNGRVTERAVKVAGDPAHPVTQGFLCGKVAKYLDRVYAPDRLLYPMRRKPGVPKSRLVRGRELEAFARISWDEALDEIAAKLSAISAEFGPESILPYSYAGTIGQLGYGSMDRRFFYRLGASQLDRTICSTAGGVALTSVYGVKLGTTPQDFAHAKFIIAWGANIHGNNIHLWPFVEEARRKGARLIVIDPYRTRTAALADEHLAIHPGTDTLLALALMHVIFRDGLEDREYMAACTTGAAELKRHALKPEHSPSQGSRRHHRHPRPAHHHPRARLRHSIQKIGRPAAIRLNYGIQRSENGGTAVRAVCMLPLLTGSWKHRGGGLQLSTSGSFPFNGNALEMPELMLASSLKRPARVVNMSRLGEALTLAERPSPIRPAGEGALRLQLEPSRRRAQPERGARRHGPPRPLHRRPRAVLHRHGRLRRHPAPCAHIPRNQGRPGCLRTPLRAGLAAGHRPARRGTQQRRISSANSPAAWASPSPASTTPSTT